MKKIRVATALALVLPALLATSLFAESHSEKKGAPPAMSPAQMEAMKAYMAAATPGEAHKKMAKMAGKWKVKVWSQMDPSAPAETSEATAEFSTMLGGRHLVQKFNGTMMGQPFEGRGTSSYDNVTGEYIDTWTDTMSTGISVMKGKANGNVITQTGSMVDAVTKKTIEMKSVGTMKSDDEMAFEMWMTGPDGKMFKCMTLDYTRAGGAKKKG